MSKKKNRELDLNELQEAANWITGQLKIQPVNVRTIKIECAGCGYSLCSACQHCHIMHCSHYQEMQEICGSED